MLTLCDLRASAFFSLLVPECAFRWYGSLPVRVRNAIATKTSTAELTLVDRLQQRFDVFELSAARQSRFD